MKKMLLHVPLAALLCVGMAAPAAAQGAATGGTTVDRTPAAGSTINDTVPYGLNDSRLNTGNMGTNGFGNRMDGNMLNGNGGNGMRGMGTNGMRGWNNNNDGIMNRLDRMEDRVDNRLNNGINDNNYRTRTANNGTMRARATNNDGTNWGWLGLLGLAGLAGMFRGSNQERHRS